MIKENIKQIETNYNQIDIHMVRTEYRNHIRKRQQKQQSREMVV